MAKTYIHLHLLAFRMLPWLVMLSGCGSAPLRIVNHSPYPAAIVDDIVTSIESLRDGDPVDLDGYTIVMLDHLPVVECGRNDNACLRNGDTIYAPFYIDAERGVEASHGFNAGELCHEVAHAQIRKEGNDTGDANHTRQDWFEDYEGSTCSRIIELFTATIDLAN